MSIATVSRVINGNYPVSNELQTRVQKVMDDLDYQPNAVARGLRRQKTQSIGVLIPKLNDPFFSTFGFTLEKALFAQDYRTLFCNTEEEPEKEAAYIDSLLQQRVDGVIMFPHEHSRANVVRLIENDVPVVLVERKIPDLPVHHVLVTNYEGGYTGVRHLIEQGHRKIGVFTAYNTHFPMRERLQGAIDALKDAGLALQAKHFLTINTDEPRFDIGYRNAMALLDENANDLPTGIFALTDEIAIGALHAFSDRGLKLPDDMSIVGFDNNSIASFVVPGLTTVAQPTVQMGETAARILLGTLEEGIDTLEHITLETKLVVRGSTAPPRR